MKKYPEKQFAKVPNDFIEIRRNRFATELEEKLIALAVVDMQAKYNALKNSHSPIDWSYIATNTIAAQKFSEILQVTNNTQKLRQSLQDLKSLGLSIRYQEYVERTGKMHMISEYVSVFSRFRFDETDNIIRYTFDEFFSKFFNEVTNNYFQLSIAEVVGLHSAHTMRIYSLLKSKLNMDKTTHEFSIEDLKKYLNLEKKYKNYFDFKRGVLDVATAQINASPSAKFQLEYKELKDGKKVVAIKFIIIALGDKYYEITNKIPHYIQNQIYKRIQKLSKHSDTIIAGASLQLLDVFNEEKCINLEQVLCKMNMEVINKRLEKLGENPLKTT